MTVATAALPRVPIEPRHMPIHFPADMPRHYVGGDPFTSHLLNALSLVFPAGEQEFIDSVRNFRERITDPELARQVRAFIAQESFHSKEHAAFNAWMKRHGIPSDVIDAEIRALIVEGNEKLTHEQRLAFTCALEHFTALMARGMLESPDLLDAAPEPVRMLLIWHAIEEMEHKAVAFDVFETVSGSYRLRVGTMLVATVLFFYDIARLQRRLMVGDGEHRNVRSYAKGIRRFFGPGGFFPRLVPSYLRYFRPDFHPWQEDDSALLARFLPVVERYRAELARPTLDRAA